MTFEQAVEQACIVNHISFDPADPEKTLANLIAWEVKTALDPAVSQEAHKLTQLAGKWQPMSQAPKHGQVIFLHCPDLVDADFNPEGVVEGYWHDGPFGDQPENHFGNWLAAVWNSTHDERLTKVVQPSDWMPQPKRPYNFWADVEKNGTTLEQLLAGMKALDLQQIIDSLKPEHIRIDTFAQPGLGGWSFEITRGIRVTHLPTGLEVSHHEERSQYANKQKCMMLLAEKLQAMVNKDD